MCMQGEHVGVAAVLKGWVPFVALMAFGIYLGGWPVALTWGLLACLLVGWFVLYNRRALKRSSTAALHLGRGSSCSCCSNSSAVVFNK
jgi:hypothetical protein